MIGRGEVGREEHFEVSDLAQEAEDRLAQLMMDDNLSDARMGDFGGEERSVSHLEPDSPGESHSPPWDEGPPEEGRTMGGSAMDSNNMATSYMSTQDLQEPQRLHHSRR